MKRFVILPKNMPARLPVWSTAVVWLLLDRLKPPEWVWGAVGFLMLTIWLILIYAVCTQETVDLFKDQDENERWRAASLKQREEEIRARGRVS